MIRFTADSSGNESSYCGSTNAYDHMVINSRKGYSIKGGSASDRKLVKIKETRYRWCGVGIN